MSTRMPNGILSHHHGGKHHHDASRTNTKQQSLAKNTTYKNSNSNNNTTTAATNQQQQTSILNVAEMLLHGVADDEILNIWLTSIECQEFAKNFVDAGYDMPTISRITPQDLTAIGITDPAKRLKILTEIKKLNLQDGIPNFKPANLSHWLSLLRLDSHYHKSLCDQQIDTIEKTCQLTWEDFEELGIIKLGHQKRMLLAIERMKEIESDEAKMLSKPLSEPIYDTSPSQILLVASAENHIMNGPIMNKQSSTSELSSTGSGSMHSLYSANSAHHQPTYATLPTNYQQSDQQQHNHSPQQQHQKQAIYSQPPSQIMQPPQPIHQTAQHQIPNLMTLDLHHQHHQQAFQTPQHHQNSHYQATQPINNPSQYMNSIYDTNNLNGQNKMAPFMNRQSLGQLPFSALANLPKHQQQLLQQCSIYATLSRQPQRVKQPPPPVPVRTNSLKSNSLVDEETNSQHSHQSAANGQTQFPANNQASFANTLYRSGTRVANRNQFNSQTLLTKNKSFSGNACMDAARARFLNRNSQQQQQQQQQIFNLPQQMQPMTNQNNGGYYTSTQNRIYGMNTIRQDGHPTNMHSTLEGDNLSLHSRQSVPPTMSLNQANTFNLKSSTSTVANHLINLRNSSQLNTNLQASRTNANDKPTHADDYDIYSDTNSTKSLILPSNNLTNSPVSINRQTSLSQESGSSQTLYNSASSGSADHNINVCNFSQSGDLASRHSTASNSTLNDVNLLLDQQVEQHRAESLDQQKNLSAKSHAPKIERFKCNATTGKDDDFPPPPSPLSLTDSDEHNLHSLNSDTNFTDISQGLMTFRVGM